MTRSVNGMLAIQRMALDASRNVASLLSSRHRRRSVFSMFSASGMDVGGWKERRMTFLRRATVNLSIERTGCEPGGPGRNPRWMGIATSISSWVATVLGTFAGAFQTIHQSCSDPGVGVDARSSATVPRRCRQGIWYHLLQLVQYRSLCVSGT